MWLTIYYKSWHSQRNQPQVHGGLSNYNHISWTISNAIPNISNVSKYFKYFKIFQICQNISKYLKYYSRYTAVCQPHKYNMREKSSCARLNLRTLKYRKCLIFWQNYFIVSHKNMRFFFFSFVRCFTHLLLVLNRYILPVTLLSVVINIPRFFEVNPVL